MRYRFIDTHCHVHFQAYKDDMDEVIKRSLDAGVGMITVGTQSTTSKRGIDVADKYAGVWATIGLHPNHLHAQEFFDANELPPGVGDDVKERDATAVPHLGEGGLGGESLAIGRVRTRAERFDAEYYRELATHPKVVAIGEFGLDYYRIPPGVEFEQLKLDQKQQEIEQLHFASEVDKPVVIHCRDAHDDQAELLKAEIERGGLARRGVIHCFTGTAAEAVDYRELGFLLSIGGIVTFGKNVMAAVSAIPLEQIMLETDAPYLTPAPFRGKRNEPQYVEYIAKKIAELKGISIEEVAEQTTANAIQLFALS